MNKAHRLLVMVGLLLGPAACGSNGGGVPSEAGGTGGSANTAGTGGSGGGSANTAGTGGTSAAGGSTSGGAPSSSSTIGDLAPNPETITIDVNLEDGFVRFEGDLYTLDVRAGGLQHKHTARSQGGTTEVSEDTTEVTAAQVSTLLDAVKKTAWHEQSDCRDVFIDGGAYPPRVTLASGDDKTTFMVSSAKCASSDHSGYGRVMTCEAFGKIFEALLAIRPGGKTAGCPTYW